MACKTAFGANPGKNADPGKYLKLAARVEKALHDQVIFKDPKQLDPESILVDPNNRDSAPPNAQYIHHGILRSFSKMGYDVTRPMVGICVEYKSEAGLRKLLEHNKRFSSPLLPPINEQKVRYGSLAGSHLNLSFRAIKVGCAGASPAGDIRAIADDSPALRDAVLNGHKWWILPESLATELKTDISLWRNADQNENQGTHEIELLQTVISTAADMQKSERKVVLGDLVAKAGKRSPAKIMPHTLQVIAIFCSVSRGRPVGPAARACRIPQHEGEPTRPGCIHPFYEAPA